MFIFYMKLIKFIYLIFLLITILRHSMSKNKMDNPIFVPFPLSLVRINKISCIYSKEN